MSEYIKYRNIDSREGKRAKEERLNGMCADIIILYLVNGRIDKVYKNIKWFFSKFKDRTTILRGINGKITIKGTINLDVWKEYIELAKWR